VLVSSNFSNTHGIHGALNYDALDDGQPDGHPTEPFQLLLPVSLLELRAARPQLPPLFRLLQHHAARTPEDGQANSNSSADRTMYPSQELTEKSKLFGFRTPLYTIERMLRKNGVELSRNVQSDNSLNLSVLA